MPLKKEHSKVFKTPLHAAIAYLIGIGAIKQDGDVAKDLEYDKSVVSAYKNGKSQPSPNFLEKFEAKYDVKLDNFVGEYLEGNNAWMLKSPHHGGKPDFTEKYVQLLEERISDQVSLNDLLERVKEIQKSVDKLLQPPAPADDPPGGIVRVRHYSKGQQKGKQ